MSEVDDGQAWERWAGAGAMPLTIHYHGVMADGVFVRGDDGAVSFQRLPPPDDDDVEALLRQCALRVLRRLRRELDDDEPEADALAALEAASLAASSCAASRRPTRSGREPGWWSWCARSRSPTAPTS